MSCGAFGGGGSCGGGGGGVGAAGAGFGAGPRHYADKRFFDPFCIPVDNKRCEPTCYFNPFVHAQCLGVDMNMQGFRNDILKCQDDYKKAVWAVLKKYALGEGKDEGNNNNTSNNSYRVPAFMNDLNLNRNNLNASMGMRNSRMLTGPTANAARRSISSGFQYDDPRMFQRAPQQCMHAPGGFGHAHGRGVGSSASSSFGGGGTSGFGSGLNGEYGLGGSLTDDLSLGGLLNGDFGLGGGGIGFGRCYGGGPMQA